MINKVTLFYLLMLSVLLALVSCSGRETLDSDHSQMTNNVDIEFDHKDSLVFYYHSFPRFDFNQVYSGYNKSKDTVVLFSNAKQNSIDFFDLETGVKFDSLMLPLNGPNGIQRLGNFIINNDSLFVIDSFRYELLIYSLDGVVLNKIKLRSDNPFETLLPRYFTAQEILKEGDKIYITGDPDLNPHDLKNYKKGRYIVEVNLTSEEVKHIGNVPKIFHNDKWMINQYFYRYAVDSERKGWVFSFESSDSVFHYSINGEVKSYYAGTTLEDNLKPWGKSDMNSQDAYKFYLSHQSYAKIIYDSYNKLYYRFVRHPNLDAVSKGDIDRMWARDFSIVILDESFNWVGETEINGKGIGENHLLTKSGVYISYYNNENAVEGVKKFVKIVPKFK
ncbi:DUF4221 family protein [Roseivirga echinicomitans]